MIQEAKVLEIREYLASLYYKKGHRLDDHLNSPIDASLVVGIKIDLHLQKYLSE